jgi:hypothetical protein
MERELPLKVKSTSLLLFISTAKASPQWIDGEIFYNIIKQKKYILKLIMEKVANPQLDRDENQFRSPAFPIRFCPD